MRRAVEVGTKVRVGLWILSLLLVLAGPSQVLRAGDSNEDDSAAGAKFSSQAAATFNGRCSACHTYGNGIKVGPDLKGVTERRKRDWLLKFIHASSGVIKSGDLRNALRVGILMSPVPLQNSIRVRPRLNP
jgi:hypothetical protein